MAKRYTATLDRIVDDRTAVLLLEEAGETVKQVDIDVSRLPADGQHEGAVFDVVLEHDDSCAIDYRPEKTQSRRERARNRLERLSTKLSDRDS